MSLFTIRHKPTGNLLNYKVEYVNESYPNYCTLVNYNTWDEYGYSSEGIWITQNVNFAKKVLRVPYQGDNQLTPYLDKSINVEDLKVVELRVGRIIKN